MAGWLDALWTFNPHPLHQYLIEHNMTQRELSRILEINPVMLSDYLRGKRKPGREVTGRMVKRLDISVAIAISTMQCQNCPSKRP